MYITDIEKFLKNYFKNTYLKKINELVSPLQVQFELNDFFKYQFIKNIDSYDSAITIISVINAELDTTLNILENHTEIQNKISSYILDFTNDIRKLLKIYFHTEQSNNTITISHKDIDKKEIDIFDTKNQIYQTELQLKDKNEIYKMNLDKIIYYTEGGYFSITENNSDIATFFTIFEAQI